MLAQTLVAAESVPHYLRKLHPNGIFVMATEVESPTPGDGSLPQNQFRLPPIHQEIFDALRERSDELANLYMGAIAVLQQTSNPDRVAQAASSLRQLMVDAPRFMDLSVPLKKRASLNDMVGAYSKRWRDCQKQSKNHSDGKWDGEIDRFLLTFLKHTEEFVSFYDETHVKIIEKATIVIRHLDQLRDRLPDPLLKLRAKEWQEMYDFFTTSLHHGRFPSDKELEGWAEALGRFLLAGWRPETAADQENLKKIIEEGESNA
jgi:hypothetical protein